MLKDHSRSYGKYTAWALGNSAELTHSVASRNDEMQNAMRYETPAASTAAERSAAIALIGAPFCVTYAAVTAGVASFGEFLRRELKGEGIHVLTVYLGRTDVDDEVKPPGPELSFWCGPTSAVVDPIVSLKPRRSK